MKIDTHFHTIFSYDSFNTLSQTVRACQKKGIECVAVTDHNEIEGALQLQAIAPFQVIIGEEIKTREGEIVGLFLKERINPAMSLAETISAIRSQDGLVYLPHPHKMIEDILEEHIDKIDIVEIFNGRNLKQEYNLYALKIAQKYNKAMAAGSDSHTPFEIGRVYFEMEGFKNQEDFLEILKNGAQLKYNFSYGNILLNRLILNHKIRKLFNRILRRQDDNA